MIQLLPLILVIFAHTVISSAGAAERVECSLLENCCDALSSAANACSPTDYGDANSVALVIGIDAYKDVFGNGLKDLQNARNDARSVGSELELQGFRVRYLFAPQRNQVVEEFKRLRSHMLAREAAAGFSTGNALIYFAGHGFGGDLDDGAPANYLIFRPDSEVLDLANATFEASGITTGSIHQGFVAVRRFRIVYVFDACRSAVSINSSAPQPATADAETRYGFIKTELASRKSRAVIYSTGFSSTAGDGTQDAKNGTYVEYLKRSLGVVGAPILSIFDATGALVADGTGNQQVPADIQVAGGFIRLPWQTPTAPTVCSSFEGSLAEAISLDCQEGLSSSWCNAALCGVYRQYEKTFGNAQCPAGRLSSLVFQERNRVPETACAPLIGAPSPSMALAQLAASTNQFDAIRKQDLMASTVVKSAVEALSARTYESPIASIPATGKLDDAVTLRPQTLTKRVARYAGALLPPTDRFALRQLPREGDPLIYSRLPDGSQARLDCTNVTCGNGYVGVTVELPDGRITRGFAAPNDVKFGRPNNKLDLAFDGASETTLTQAELDRLEREVRMTIRNGGKIEVYSYEDPRLTEDRKFIDTKRSLSLNYFVRSIHHAGKRLGHESIVTYTRGPKSGAGTGVISILFFDGN